jgi:cell division protein FtsX
MKQFQQEAFLVTLKGTIPGALLAGAAYWALGSYISSLQSNMLPAMMLKFSHIMLLIVMPLACGGIAWLAARISVIKQLQRVL